MKMITAFVVAEQLDFICTQLIHEGILGMTVTQSCGHGRDAILVASMTGGPDIPDLMPTTMIEVAVAGNQLNRALRAIVTGLKSEGCCQGKIIVRDLETVVDIRTGSSSDDEVNSDRSWRSQELQKNLSSGMR